MENFSWDNYGISLCMASVVLGFVATLFFVIGKIQKLRAKRKDIDNGSDLSGFFVISCILAYMFGYWLRFFQ